MDGGEPGRQHARSSCGITTVDARTPPADTYAELAAGAGASHVEGLGDDAVWADDQLYVVIGAEMVSFEIEPLAGVPVTDLQPATVALAQVGMPRYEPTTAG